MSNPYLGEEDRARLVGQLMTARREIRRARKAADSEAENAARATVEKTKQALGERGSVWWIDGAPDLNRRLAKNTPYADWYANL